jgi:hypothetical protein
MTTIIAGLISEMDHKNSLSSGDGQASGNQNSADAEFGANHYFYVS